MPKAATTIERPAAIIAIVAHRLPRPEHCAQSHPTIGASSLTAPKLERLEPHRCGQGSRATVGISTGMVTELAANDADH